MTRSHGRANECPKYENDTLDIEAYAAWTDLMGQIDWQTDGQKIGHTALSRALYSHRPE